MERAALTICSLFFWSYSILLKEIGLSETLRLVKDRMSNRVIKLHLCGFVRQT